MAEDVGEIVTASQKILQLLSSFRKQVEELRPAEQQFLKTLRASTISANKLREHESSILNFEGMGKKLEALFEEMAQRIEELQS